MLEPQRQEIDLIDSEILRLLNKRGQHVLRIAAEKARWRRPIRDWKREWDIFERLGLENAGPLDRKAIRRIFGQILFESRRLQRQVMSSRP